MPAREDQQRALAAGFDSFFVKPLNPQQPAKLLRIAVSRRRPERRRAARTQLRISSRAPGSLSGSSSSAAYSFSRL